MIDHKLKIKLDVSQMRAFNNALYSLIDYRNRTVLTKSNFYKMAMIDTLESIYMKISRALFTNKKCISLNLKLQEQLALYKLLNNKRFNSLDIVTWIWELIDKKLINR